MNKALLSQHMADHFRARGRAFNRHDARKFLEELERVARRELREGGKFLIPNLAKLAIEHRPARQGRHPTTGEPLRIPARRVVRAYPFSAPAAALDRSGHQFPDGDCCDAGLPVVFTPTKGVTS